MIIIDFWFQCLACIFKLLTFSVPFQISRLLGLFLEAIEKQNQKMKRRSSNRTMYHRKIIKTFESISLACEEQWSRSNVIKRGSHDTNCKNVLVFFYETSTSKSFESNSLRNGFDDDNNDEKCNRRLNSSVIYYFSIFWRKIHTNEHTKKVFRESFQVKCWLQNDDCSFLSFIKTFERFDSMKLY